MYQDEWTKWEQRTNNPWPRRAIVILGLALVGAMIRVLF